MILQALTQYYEAMAAKGEISQPGWCQERVGFQILISESGELRDIIPCTEEKPGKNGKTREVPQTLTVPQRVSGRTGSTFKANFLCDNAAYFLGLDTKGNPARAKKSFETAKAFHLELLAGAEGQTARAVKNFFQRWQPERAAEHPAVASYLEDLKTANLVFWVESEILAHEDPYIMEAWNNYQRQSAEGQEEICLVTGKRQPIAELHGSIKGIPGAQTAGAKLISYNATAFESYGKDGLQGLNAPVGKHAAFAYVTALNSLLANEKNRRQLGDTTVVFWSEQDTPEPVELMGGWMQPESAPVTPYVRGVLEHLAKGQVPAELDVDKRFYILGLSPNAARISVRFFLVDTFGAFLKNIKEHHKRLELAGCEAHLLSAYGLVRETVNQNSTDKKPSPLLLGELLRAVLTGARYPMALVQGVMERIRAEQDNPDRHMYKLTPGRVAILKAYLLQTNKLTQQEREEITVALNTTFANRAYVLGRLFAMLENLQQHANPGIKATIKSTYFTAASSTPASVFPRLMQLAQHHMNKLGEKRVIHEKKIAEVFKLLDVEKDPFPVHFNFEEQNLFVLGYYQQRQDRFDNLNNKEETDNGGN